MNRRSLLKTTVAAPFLNLGRANLFGAERSYSTRAIDLVSRSTVIDMLSPFALASSVSMKWLTRPETFTPAHLAEFRVSGINAFHIALGIGGADAYMNV